MTKEIYFSSHRLKPMGFQSILKKKTPPRIFINKNNKVNPEDDIELYSDLEEYDSLGHNTDPKQIECMQKLVKNTNPHHNDHTQVPEKKYGLPDNNKGLREMDEKVERMKKIPKIKILDLASESIALLMEPKG